MTLYRTKHGLVFNDETGALTSVDMESDLSQWRDSLPLFESPKAADPYVHAPAWVRELQVGQTLKHRDHGDVVYKAPYLRAWVVRGLTYLTGDNYTFWGDFDSFGVPAKEPEPPTITTLYSHDEWIRTVDVGDVVEVFGAEGPHWSRRKVVDIDRGSPDSLRLRVEGSIEAMDSGDRDSAWVYNVLVRQAFSKVTETELLRERIAYLESVLDAARKVLA